MSAAEFNARVCLDGVESPLPKWLQWRSRYAYSSWCVNVAVRAESPDTVECKGADYDPNPLVPINPPADYLAKSPLGKVLCYEDDNVVVPDSFVNGDDEESTAINYGVAPTCYTLS